MCTCFAGVCVLRFLIGATHAYAKSEEPNKWEIPQQSFTVYEWCNVKGGLTIYMWQSLAMHACVLLKNISLAAQSLIQQYSKASSLCSYDNHYRSFPKSSELYNSSNYISANRLPLTVCGLFPTSCQVIQDHVVTTQIPYCEQEMSSYKDDQENRLAISHFIIYM